MEGIQLFRAFLERHPHVRKWIIAADFSLHNKDRPLECFAFTFLPYDAWPNEIKRDASSALPRDLKKSKSLDDEAIQWLRESRRFHVAITVNKNPAVFSNGHSSIALKVVREHIDQTLAQATNLGIAEDRLKRFKALKQDAQANGFNVGLLADIWLLAIWFAILTVLLGRERQCEIVGWFPDRDSMTNYCDHIWHDYALWNAQAFAAAFEVDMRGTQCPIGVPDRSSPKAHVVRLHDPRGGLARRGRRSVGPRK